MQTTVVYETAASRIAIAYRLLTQRTAARTLLLTVPGRQPVTVEGWDGEVCTSYAGHEISHLASFATSSFDRVVLHWALDEFVASPGRRRSAAGQHELLLETLRLLKPGGAVAGCASNLLTRAASGQALTRGRTPGSLERQLAGAGFVAPSVSIVLPSADAPRTIVGFTRVSSSHYFDEQFSRAVMDQAGPREFLLGTLVHTGLNRFLQGSLLFTGRAP